MVPKIARLLFKAAATSIGLR